MARIGLVTLAAWTLPPLTCHQGDVMIVTANGVVVLQLPPGDKLTVAVRLAVPTALPVKVLLVTLVVVGDGKLATVGADEVQAIELIVVPAGTVVTLAVTVPVWPTTTTGVSVDRVTVQVRFWTVTFGPQVSPNQRTPSWIIFHWEE